MYRIYKCTTKHTHTCWIIFSECSPEYKITVTKINRCNTKNVQKTEYPGHLDSCEVVCVCVCRAVVREILCILSWTLSDFRVILAALFCSFLEVYTPRSPVNSTWDSEMFVEHICKSSFFCSAQGENILLRVQTIVQPKHEHKQLI